METNDRTQRVTALVTGSASGLGLEITKALHELGMNVIEFDLADGWDVTSEQRVGDFFATKVSRLDILVNCAGVNIIDWLENFELRDWNRVMDVNARAIYTMSRAALPLLKESKGTILNVVSNAAHMPMTCSLAYNASKAAAHIMTQQLARELTKKHGITVFGVAPNKLAGTGMSNSIDEQVVATRGWTKEYAQEYQLAGLLTGEETPPEYVAEFIAFLLSARKRHRFLTGCILPYGA